MRPNPVLPLPTIVEPATIGQSVPAGFVPGPYDVVVTNPAGEMQALRNGYEVATWGAGAGLLFEADAVSPAGCVAEGTLRFTGAP